jgi:hypothetical protein
MTSSADLWQQAATHRRVLALLQADGTFRYVLPLRVALETEAGRSWHVFERLEGDWAAAPVTVVESRAGIPQVLGAFPFPPPDIDAVLRAGPSKEGPGLLAYAEALHLVARYGLTVGFSYSKPGVPTEARKGLALGSNSKQLFVSDHDREGETRGFLFSRMDGLHVRAGQRLPVWREGAGYTILPDGDEKEITSLQQFRPTDAPEWAFWFESNSVFGWVLSTQDWAFVCTHHTHRPIVSKARQATREHSSTVMHTPSDLSFGFRSEHIGGKRTLADHAAEHGLTWLTDIPE